MNTLIRNENYGVTYERFSLAMFIKRVVSLYNIRTVLDTSNNGMKGLGGLNSLEFARQDCEVYAADVKDESRKIWFELNLGSYVRFLKDCSLTGLSFDKDSFDLVWNLKGIAKSANPLGALEEMIRVSRDVVLIVSINGAALNFAIHRLAHKVNNVDWDHGDVNYMNPEKMSALFRKCGLHSIRQGGVDVPPWPASLGFKDLKYHLEKKNEIIWHSEYLDYLKKGKYPFWLRVSYLFEGIPVSLRVKLIYAHLFYVIGRKVKDC